MNSGETHRKAAAPANSLLPRSKLRPECAPHDVTVREAPVAADHVQTANKLRSIAAQAPLSALPLSRPVQVRATTLGFVLISDVMRESWPQLSTNFGEAGANEISSLLVEFGLKDQAVYAIGSSD